MIYENIKGFVPMSLVDWDGKVSCVIFLAGCNFKCKFCHNKELVLEPAKLKSISLEEIKNYLSNNKEFIDGVVITGGEPCIYEELPDLCEEIKKLGFKLKIETNGAYPGMLKVLLDKKLVDFVSMDIKTSFENYKEITNFDIDIEKIKKAILLISNFPDYEFRITLYPEIKKEDLIKIAEYLKNAGANKAFFIQQFRAENCIDEDAEKFKPYSTHELDGFLEDIKPYFKKAGLRNI